MGKDAVECFDGTRPLPTKQPIKARSRLRISGVDPLDRSGQRLTYCQVGLRLGETLLCCCCRHVVIHIFLQACTNTGAIVPP